ncbi:hypothetical protein KSD_70900 [Ktedonobacter sp. SOSP1-85]|uniref:nucleotidyltransferase domain-containing protein n=1 Tax=Ktedonobacter sp. SOSP1-85 TaxID=2778367 RepID=UPI001914E9BA|nr:nucleotidyltransferase domain-containing protein [Ktedonobacter sp. SOSP1-85]GHO79319.1 hypothetical protein KSD_70900 [Ktedonobacter sp. SOSP1-85]
MSRKRTAFVHARERLLAEISERLRHDERFVAAWLAGSYGRGKQTWLSDLDIHVVVADAYSEHLCATPWPDGARTTPERLALFSQFGTPGIMYDAHRNNIMGGTFTYVAYQESGQNVDWMLIPQAKAHKEYPCHLLFDKVDLPKPPALEPESVEECIQRASMHVGFFWMIAAGNAKNLLKNHPTQFHTLLIWLEDSIREAQAALKGERAQFTKASRIELYTTQEEQIAALRRLCDEMEELMPIVEKKGGYLPSDPHAIVEKRLELLAEQ